MSRQIQIDFGRALRDAGIARAEAKEPLIDEAREIARQIYVRASSVTIDDVQDEIFRRHGRYLSNAAGAVFQRGEWEHTGEWRQSTRPTNHAHQNRVWRRRRE